LNIAEVIAVFAMIATHPENGLAAVFKKLNYAIPQWSFAENANHAESENH